MKRSPAMVNEGSTGREVGLFYSESMRNRGWGLIIFSAVIGALGFVETQVDRGTAGFVLGTASFAFVIGSFFVFNGRKHQAFWSKE